MLMYYNGCSFTKNPLQALSGKNKKRPKVEDNLAEYVFVFVCFGVLADEYRYLFLFFGFGVWYWSIMFFLFFVFLV